MIGVLAVLMATERLGRMKQKCHVPKKFLIICKATYTKKSMAQDVGAKDLNNKKFYELKGTEATNLSVKNYPNSKVTATCCRARAPLLRICVTINN